MNYKIILMVLVTLFCVFVIYKSTEYLKIINNEKEIEDHHWEGHTARRIVDTLNLGDEQSDLILKVMELEQKNKELKDNQNSVYKERNTLVALLARIYPSGIKKTSIEGWSPEWHNCVYIELPCGSQCSWHYHDRDAYLFENLPSYEKEWDGHTTENKYFNIEQLVLSGSIGKQS